MLFAKGNRISVALLMNSLTIFQGVSGLAVNSSKSAVYLGGVSQQVRKDILMITGFQQGRFPFRYLGVPLLSTRLNSGHYGPLLDSLDSMLNGWKLASLSYAGRLELIRTCIQGVMGFWLGIFPLPISIIHKVERTMRAILWGKSCRVRYKPLVGWSSVCLPKSEGGLAIRDLQTWNLALLSKILWDVHNRKDSLWIRWLDHVYLKGCNIWGITSKVSDSTLWKKLLYIRNLLTQKLGDTSATIRQLEQWCVGSKLQTKKVYNLLRQRGSKVLWNGIIWLPDIYPRWAFRLWLCVSNKLLTLDKAQYLQRGTSCYLCGRYEETNEHLFFMCRFSKSVLNKLGWSFMNANQATSYIATLTGTNRKRCCITLAATVYVIWDARNEAIFLLKNQNADQVANRAHFLSSRAIHLARLNNI